jgi:hypothetical protein
LVKPIAPANSLLDKLNPGTPPIFGTPVRANSDNTQFGQHEPSMAVSRIHPNTVVVASKDYRDNDQKHVWIESSTDGGATWPLSRQLQMPGIDPGLYPLQSDAVVMARDDGRIYVACLGYSNDNAVFITWTDDDGATWHPSVRISPVDTQLDDKDWFAVDNTPSSPHYHTVYMMYAPGAGYVAEQHSTDGGLTWTSRQSIGQSGTEYTYPVVGHDGTVYNFMMYNWGANQTGTIQLTKSTNGGVTWSSPTTVALAQQPNTPIRSTHQFRFFAILSAAVDPNNGSLYVAWTDNRYFNTRGTEVLFVKSTDSGATWTSADAPSARLSHDPTGQYPHDHITPMLAVGSDSKLHAFWLDTRNDPRDCTQYDCLFDSWYNSSTDGGASWDLDTQITTQSQNLDTGLPPGSGGAAGDYWGLDTTQNVVYVAWNDTLGGDQDIYVSRGVMGGGTPTPAPSNTPTAIPTNTSIPGPTNTVVAPSPTGATATATATAAANPSATSNPAATATETPIPGSATATATACTIQFSDVPVGSTFYPYVHTMACRGIISGYPDGTFRPNNNVTRGQLSKIVANSAGFNDPQPNQMFEDVPVGSTFQVYIGRLASRSYISGYPCGGPGEPCHQGNLPYFRPNANATRGQISKIVANSAGFNDPPGVQIFQDVAPGSTFYDFIQRLASRGVMGGYACGGPGEPCVPPGNMPYFRPNNNATRGQTSKIVANTFFP